LVNRLTLFAKGNLDLRDSLHSLRLGETLAWNGVNEIVRERHPDWTIRLRHETWARSDALLEAAGVAPDELAARNLSLEAARPRPSARPCLLRWPRSWPRSSAPTG
jgi:hypothetical protein